MVLMKSAAGNAFFNVPENMVEQKLQRGFIICEDNNGGGSAPPPATFQDEKPTLQEVLKDIEPEKVEPVKVVEVIENPLMMDGLYGNQMNRPQLIQWHKREGIEYDRYATKAELLKNYNRYAKEIKAQKKG